MGINSYTNIILGDNCGDKLSNKLMYVTQRVSFVVQLMLSKRIQLAAKTSIVK